MLGFAEQDPAHVRPPFAVAGRMRVAVEIRVLMVNPVRGHPEDRPAFHGQCSADGKEVLEPLRNDVGAMGVQAMVTHADAPANGDPVEDSGDDQRAPLEEKRGGKRTEMENAEEGGGNPIHLVIAIDGGGPRGRFDHRRLKNSFTVAGALHQLFLVYDTFATRNPGRRPAFSYIGCPGAIR
jgi:hypothetical protein